MADWHQVRSEITPEACWEVLERAAQGQSLKRAARLREFLLYVGAQSLKSGRGDLHEQEIGETVFGRAAAYDTSQDNIVRVSATELRKRVDAYFAGEGKDEQVIFEIPRGSYMPAFRLRASAAAEAAGAPGTAAPIRWPLARRVPVAIVCAVVIVLAIACAMLWRENRLLLHQVHDCPCAAGRP